MVPAMKLTARGRYSIKAMLDLALQRGLGPCPVRAIAQRQNIPMPYLEKLLIELRRAGLVESLRGTRGGYQLARDPKEIFLGEILRAVGESFTAALGQEMGADLAEDWVMRSLWKRLAQKIGDALDRISLEDLYFDARSWQAAKGQDSNFII
jgi:Rrf2 family protein